MTTKDSLLDILGQTALFGMLDPHDRQSVVGEMREASYGAGEMIFGRGDPGRDIYLVVAGRVRLSVLTPEGRELSFAHAECGQVFGEISVLDGGTRTADATAVTKVEVRTLSKGALGRLIETRPPVRDSIIRFLCNRVREADQQLEGIALYPIEVRLARFFLATAKQKGQSEAERVTLDLPISQSELALLIGASRPKVNAALALLEEQGAIDKTAKGFVCMIETLEDIANSG